MIALRVPELSLNRALAGVAMLLAGVALWPWLVPPLPTVRPLATPPAAAAPPALAALPPLGAFAAIVERPLFSPSRRAAPGATAAAAGPPVAGRYRLIGIMGAGANRKAFVADGGRRAEITEGESFDGWTVKEIRQDRVLLTSPGGTATLTLNHAAPEPAKPQ